MDSSKFKAIIIVVLAMILALYLGTNAATAQLETIAWILGGTTLAICLLLGRSVWLLIPFLMAVNIQLRIPGQPNTLMLAQILVLGFSILLIGVRKIHLRPKFTELEFLMLGLAVLVIQVYVRNPAGLWLMQTETVGGKAYFVFALTLASALYLCLIDVQQKDIKRIFPLIVIGSIINICVAFLGKVVPTIGFFTGANYTADGQTVSASADSGAATRFLEASLFGQKLALFVSSLKNPLKAAFHPLWLLAILLSIACALIGGFRSGLAAVLLTYMVGTYYRGGFGAVMLGGLGGVMAISLLAVINVMVPLPPNVQRTLTFLPGTWEQRYKDDADGSTQWRVDMWKEALLTDRWIENKMFGDGLGFTKQQLDFQMSLAEGRSQSMGMTGWDLQRELAFAAGDYHSGPVSTIRVIGYVGLAFLIYLQFRLAVHAHRLILRCRGTEWYALALLIGIPAIWGPVFFHFLFGDFRNEAISLLMTGALIRLLERGIPLIEKQSVSNGNAIGLPRGRAISPQAQGS